MPAQGLNGQSVARIADKFSGELAQYDYDPERMDENGLPFYYTLGVSAILSLLAGLLSVAGERELLEQKKF